MAFLGMDIGSVSVKTALLAPDGTLGRQQYRRHFGRPLETARNLLDEELAAHPGISALGLTGSGGKAVAEALQAPFENEVLCQARAAAHLTPEAQTLIVVGGEDSFLVLLEPGSHDGQVQIRDFAMNGLCAAGCGSFLDQQASRLGVEIEGEFGDLALASARPARVAGRCSVFAKSDMIHLQQKATPVRDIVAGLCYAFARNFSAVQAKGKEMRPPVVFHGGVANNAGMVRAFRDIFNLSPDEFLAPPHAATAGAIGAALLARQAGPRTAPLQVQELERLAHSGAPRLAHPPLPDPGSPPGSHVMALPPGSEKVPAFLGVDIGSISTNVVLLDDQKRVLAKRYLMTAGRPIEAVRQGLEEIGADFADKVEIRGLCTTGSGRYLIGDFIGADVVKNEITAQARAAAEIDPLVDTIFEIGGQDSKYISLDQGAIVDFEMNKVCAAGTGSFLEEQADRLGISIKGEFACLATASDSPVRLGERCTVFMESDVVGHQARGASTGDLTAGLAYSIVHNYLNRVVGERKVGERIFFQGGTAFNRAVVAAFGQVTGKPITVPEHHEVTGAIGCALIAREHAVPGVPSRFKGWDVARSSYAQKSFGCKGCANLCEVNRVQVKGDVPLFYGGRCEKFEKKRAVDLGLPDLFAEREAALLAHYAEGSSAVGKPFIGIPRTLHFLEYAPFWLAFFNALKLPVKLSSPTGQAIVTSGLEATQAEFCFPVKVAHGHALELIDAGVTHLFLPNVVQLPKLHAGYVESVACPLVQSMAYTLQAAIMPEKRGVAMLAPAVDLSFDTNRTARNLSRDLKAFGVTRGAVDKALKAAQDAQEAFTARLARRGDEILASIPADGRAVVIVSRPYNGCDNGINLEIPTRLRELGILPIPLDMLSLDAFDLSGEFPDLTWRYGQKFLASADLIRKDPRLEAVFLTNFGCGPDSFLMKFFRSRMGEKTFLQIEIDEHSSDVGIITRLEAFLDSLPKRPTSLGSGRPFLINASSVEKQRTIYIPYMCDAARFIAAAFRSVGVPAEVLPESTTESVAVGKRFCSGKECFPCIVTTGDMVRFISRPDVDPDKVTFFMPNVSGGCRFGYYNALQRMVLDELGFRSVPIYAPNQDRGLYDTLGKDGGDLFVRRAWQGIVAQEMLERALHHVRPGEHAPGKTDLVYQEQLHRLIGVMERGEDPEPLMRRARKAFESIPSNNEGRPHIVLIGEIFVRYHQFSNQNIIRRLEELGGRVQLAPFSEWMYYVNFCQKEDASIAGKWATLFRLHLTDRVMKQDERRLARVWEGFLPQVHEPYAEELMEEAAPYMDSSFRGEGILGIGKALHAKRDGAAGIVNVMPFTCMPGNITCGIFKRLQQEHDGLPILNLSFDGQESADITLRLEAFLQQCRAYSRRQSRAEAGHGA